MNVSLSAPRLLAPTAIMSALTRLMGATSESTKDTISLFANRHTSAMP